MLKISTLQVCLNLRLRIARIIEEKLVLSLFQMMMATKCYSG